MIDPQFSIGLQHRTRNGSLFTHDIQKVRHCLRGRGFVLLPSDTCYAIATMPNFQSIQDMINCMLTRDKEPISLAFPDLERLEDWVSLSLKTAALIEQLTPGPITVVCKGWRRPPYEFTEKVLQSKGNTIGVRIPDSAIERQVAGCTRYPTTTVAVRDPDTKQIVQDFERACQIVGAGVDRLDKSNLSKTGTPVWCAIEGEGFYFKHSTVVHVTELEKVALIREGDIPFEKILKAAEMMPLWAIEDWT